MPGTHPDPWSPERSVWPLLQLVDEHLDDELMWPWPPTCGLLPRLARRKAPALHGGAPPCRPVRQLRRPPPGNAAGLEGAPRAARATGPRPEDMAWQAELWRHLRQRLGVPSPAERFEARPPSSRLRPISSTSPSRISLFGLTRLPASHLRVLKAISAHRDVHLFLAPPLGGAVAKGGLRSRAPPAGSAPRDRPYGACPCQPAVALLGPRRPRDAARAGRPGCHRRRAPARSRGATSTLLGLLQADIRADRPPPGPPHQGRRDARPLLAEGDDSLRVHSCHGRARQVEVVREAVLHLLAADPTLEPRDVIVMCPDIELFAPLIQASFGVADLAGRPTAAGAPG